MGSYSLLSQNPFPSFPASLQDPGFQLCTVYTSSRWELASRGWGCVLPDLTGTALPFPWPQSLVYPFCLPQKGEHWRQCCSLCLNDWGSGFGLCCWTCIRHRVPEGTRSLRDRESRACLGMALVLRKHSCERERGPCSPLFGPWTKPLWDLNARTHSLFCWSQFGLEFLTFFFFSSNQPHSNRDNRLVWGLLKLFPWRVWDSDIHGHKCKKKEKSYLFKGYYE